MNVTGGAGGATNYGGGGGGGGYAGGGGGGTSSADGSAGGGGGGSAYDAGTGVTGAATTAGAGAAAKADGQATVFFTPTLTFTSTPSSPSAGGTYPVTVTSPNPATGGSGIGLTGTAGVCTVGTVNDTAGQASATVTFVAAGSCTITATQGASGFYNAAVNATQTFAVSGPSITTSSLPAATTGQTNYSQPLAASGGITPYTWSLASGALPGGLSISSAGVISGPNVTATAGSYSFTVKVTDANSAIATKSLSITVNGAPSITTSSLPAATTGQTNYSQPLAATSGTTPYTWSLASGALPGGLSISSAGVISGPNVTASAGSYSFTVQVTDVDGVVATKLLSITVNDAPTITTASLPAATTGQTNYSQPLAATNGTTPYTWSLASGTLPGGLSISSAGVISGPNVTATAGSYSFTVKVTDANGVAATQTLSITVNAAPTITTSSLPAATTNQTNYSQQLAAINGTGAYAWSLASGTLPGGLTISSSGVISGSNVTATAGTFNFTVKVIDANGVAVTKALSITVNGAPTISPTSLPSVTAGGTYPSQQLTVTGGTTPFSTWSLASGSSLPSWLSLSTGGLLSSNGTESGTPPFTFTVQITDANGVTATRAYTITVNAAPTITTSSLPAATTGQTNYSQPLAATSGTTPYTWSLASGALPGGLSISSAGVISGPNVTASAGSYSFTVQVTDVDGVVATKLLSITVNDAPTITTASLPAATTGQTNYSQPLAATNGTTPYTWSLASGTLPGGLSISSAGVISGPNVTATAGSFSFTVKVTDANGVAATQTLSITVNAAPSITTSSLPAATTGQTNYSQQLAAINGTGAYAWSLASGTLPGGLTISSSGVISGSNVTATAGTFNFTVKVIDANGVAVTKALSITVNGAPTISPTSLPSVTAGGTYPSQQLTVTGGTTPFSTWSLASGSSLPSWLSLSTGGLLSSNGTESGTPPFTFTVQITDANGVIATRAYTITVNGAPSITTTSPLATATTGQTNYSQTIIVSGGTAPYTWATFGTPPGGLSISSAGVISGPNVTATAGSYSFTVKVTDANGIAASKVFSITVNAAPTITTSSLPAATTNQTNYSQQLAAINGTGAYAWSLASGTLPGGLTISSSGVISGSNVTATAGTFNFTVKVIDANGVAVTKALSITVNGAPTISPTSLPSVTAGGTYPSQQLTVTGGTTPFSTWSLASGSSLPSWLSLSTGGLLSSNGTESGTPPFTFTVQITDANGVIATRAYTITVNAAPTITPTSLPPVTAGGFYAPQQLTVTGGIGPFTWSVATGSSLPSWLSLNASTGQLSPIDVESGAGPFTFTIQVTDANGVTATQAYTITVNPAPSITTTTLATATAGQTGYHSTVTATGGTGTYTWATFGTLPPSLSINSSTGVISGNVGAGATTLTFTVQVTDAEGVAATQTLTITVNPAPSITTTTLATATQGQTGYSAPVVATGGTGAYNWSISSGVLPNGLSIAPSTGIISGTVGAGATTQTFTVQVTDANGVIATKSLTITVDIPPSITSTNSATFAVGFVGTSFQATATGNPAPTFSNVGFNTCSPTGPPSGVNFSAAGLLSGTPAAGTAGTYILCINASNGVGTAATQKFTLTVLASPNQLVILSSPQTIAGSNQSPGATSGSVIVQTQSSTGSPVVQTSPLTVNISYSSLGTNVTITQPGTLTIPAGSSIGTFTFAAENSSNNTNETFGISLSATASSYASSPVQTETVLFDNISTSTTIGAITGQTVIAGGAATFTVPVTSNNQASHNYEVISVGGLMSGETASFPTGCQTTSGTANFSVPVVTSSTRAPGSYVLTFVVERFNNGGCTGNDDYYQGNGTLTVVVPVPPAITSANSTTFAVGSAGTFTVTGTGAPAPTFAVTGSLPTGVTFNTSTGVLSGTPATGTAGLYPLTITASNGVNPAATQSFTLTVTGPATSGQGTMTVSPSTVVTSSLQTLTFTFTAPTWGGFAAGSTVELEVPTGTGWTAPTSSNTSIINTSCSSAVFAGAPGNGNYFVTVSCAAGQSFQIVYGSTPITVGSIGTATFVTTTQAAGSPTAVAISPAPSVNVTAAATNGSGTMVITAPAWTTANSTNNQLVFVFTAGSGSFITGSRVEVDLPTGWTTVPSLSNTSVTLLSGSCGTMSLTFSSNQIFVNMACAAGASFQLNYGVPGNGNQVTAGAAGTATFVTYTRYGGGTGFGSPLTSGSPSLTVRPAVSMAISNNSVVTGQTLVFTATVTATTSFTPSGTVDFNNGVTDICTDVVLVGGMATCSIPNPVAGTYTVTATYNSDGADPNYGVSSITDIAVVTKSGTTTTTTTSLVPVVSGQTITVSATVAPSGSGSGTPTGTVVITDGVLNGQTCTITLGTNTSCTIVETTPATYTLTGTYSGDNNFSVSSGTATVVVNKSGTTTSTTTNLNPVVSGQTITVSATVSPSGLGSGTPTGTVVVTDGVVSGQTCTITLGLNNNSCNITETTPTTYTLTGDYSGDNNFSASSGTDTVVVGTDATTSTVTNDASSPVTGATFTFTDTVTADSSSNVPAGTVAWTVTDPNGNAVTCSDTTLAGGFATCTITNAIAGTYSASAVFTDTDGNFQGSTSLPDTVVVGTDATTSTVTNDASSPVTGATFTFTDTVTADSSSNVPAGTVAWTVTDPNGNAVTCSDTTLAGGFATCTITNAIAGTYSASAVFTDTDGNFQGSTSLPDTVVVGTDATTSTVTNDASSPVTGATFTFTDTVTADSSSNVPAGTVAWTVTDPNGNAVTCSDTTLAGGFATCTITNAIAGTYSASAVFTDTDGNFQGSTSLPDTVVVGTDATTSTVTNDASSPVTGATFTFTDTVTADSSSNVPAGTVAWTVTDPNGNAVTCSDTTLAGGFATCTITNAIAGTYSASAVFTDTDGNFQGSTSLPDTVVVGTDATTSTVTNDASSPVTGATFTFTDTVTADSSSNVPAGTVAWTVTDPNGNAVTCSDTTLAGGFATCTITNAIAGTYSASAVFTDTDGNFQGSTSLPDTVVVGTDATTSTVTNDASSPVTGATFTFTDTVTADSSSNVPAGTVAWTVTDPNGNAVTCSDTTLAGGFATCTITNAIAGTYSASAVFTDTDGNFQGSTSLPDTVVVGTDATTSTVTNDASSPVTGATFTFTDTVTADSSSNVPAGTVAWTVTDPNGNAVTCSDTTLAGGFATCTITNAIAGTYSASAVFTDTDGNFQGSTSLPDTVVVGTDATTSTVTNDASSPVTGATFTFTDTVTADSSSNVPAGTVAWTVTDPNGNAVTCSDTTLAGGFATCTITNAIAGTYSASAVFTDTDGNFQGSTSLPDTVVVGTDATTSTVTNDASSPVTGATFTFTDTVTADSSSNVPAGTVAWTVTDPNGNAVTCSDTTLAGGFATCTITNAIAGTYSASAVFTDTDGNFQGSTSLPDTVVVGTDATTSTVTNDASSPVTGATFTFTDTVTADSSSNVPAGTVAWTVTDPNGNAVTCSDTTLAGGFATCTITNAIAGTYSASAVFTDTDGNFQGSTSLPDTVVVGTDATTSTVTNDASSPVTGATFTFTDTVTADSSSNVPAGTVAWTVTDPNGNAVTCSDTTLAGGFATCTITNAIAGTYSASAVFTDTDGNFQGSTSLPDTVVVGTDATTSTVTNDASSPVTGATFTFTDTVTADSSSNVPAGTVAWTVTDPNGNAVTCSDTTLAGGFATCTITNAIAGTYSASAVFTDTDGNFQGSTSLPDTVVVGTDATTSTVTNDASSPVTGATFTFTDTVTADSSSNVPAGTVAWTVTDPNGNAVTCSDTTLAGGFATCTITNAIAGTYSASAVFTDTDGNFQGSTSLPDTVVVGTDATTSTVTNDASSPVTGATFTFTDTVTADSSSNVPAGTVAWTVTDPNGNAVTCSDTTLAGGFATCTITNAIAGTYSASAVFTDTDGNFQGSTSLPDTVVVGTDATTSTVTNDASSPVTGATFTFTDTVTADSSSNVPAGTVAWTVTDPNGNAVTCSDTTLAGGFATCTITNAIAGTYSASAVFTDTDGNFQGSTSLPDTVVVGTDATTSTVTNDASSPVTGATFTFTDTVTADSSSNVPAGTVAWTVTDPNGNAVTCSDTTLAGGFATCTITNAIAGTYSASAVFTDTDGNFQGSTSLPDTVVVGTDATTSTVTNDASSPVTGATFTFTDTVTADSSSNVPAGTVAWTVTDPNGNAVTCSDTTLAGGFATCTITNAIAGTYSASAVFTDTDGNFQGSTSLPDTVVVGTDATTSTVTNDASSPVTGATFTFTDTVTADSSSNVPAGTVAWTVTDPNGNAVTCSDTTLAGGFATCTITNAIAGTYSASAVFTDTDGNFQGSTSLPDTVVVGTDATTSTVTNDASSPVTGATFTFTDTVTADSSSNVPAGTVAWTVTDPNGNAVTCSDTTLAGGFATCTITNAIAGTYSASAVFTDTDGNFQGSTSLPDTVVVGTDATTSTVTNDASSPVTGATFTFTDTVTADSSSNVPAGTVAWTVTDPNGNAVTCSDTTLAGGFATCTITNAIAGTYSASAVFTDTDGNFQGSTSLPDTVVVGTDATTSTVTNDASSPVTGATFTFTDTVTADSSSNVPAGTVAWTVTDPNGNAVTCSDTTLAGGFATCTITNAIAGTYSASAVFTDTDGNFQGSTSLPDTVVVGTDATTSTVTNDASSPVTGATFTFTDTVTADSSSNVPAGTVAWTVTDPNGNAVTCSDTTLAGGFATCTITNAIAGTYSASAVFTDTDGNFQGSTSLPDTVVVGTDATTSTVTNDASSPVTGATFTFTDTVTADSSSNVPAGTVAWTVTDPNGNAVTCSDTTLAGGFATCTITNAIAGTYSASAVFTDTDGNFQGSTSLPDTVVVGTDATTSTVTNDASSPVTGATFTFTDTVTADSSSNVPAGTVAWTVTDPNGNAVTCSDTTLAGGFATCTITNAIAGTYSASAVFTDTDGNFQGSTSLPDTVVVGTDATTSTVTNDASSPVTGATFTFTDTVTADSSSNVPAGTVAWTVTDPNGNAVTCSDTTLAGGFATCTITNAIAGTYSASAVFTDTDGNFQGSTSLPDTVVVGTDATTSTVTNDASSPVTGATFTFTDTVTADSSSNVPAGTVAWTVTDPNGNAVTCSDTTLAGGFATCTITNAIAGTYSASAVFTDTDGNFQGSTSLPDTVVVGTDATTSTVTNDASSPVTGATFTFTDTVTADSSSNVPAGTVAWTVTDPNGNAVTCSDTTLAGGFATCTITNAIAGTYSASAVFTDTDGNFQGSTSLPDTVVVGTDATTSTVTNDASSPVTGATFTFTDTVTADSSSNVPAGTVAWTVTDPNGNAVTCSDTTLAGGFATCTITNAIAGTYSASAVFTDTDGNFQGSTSLPDTVVVGTDATTSTVTNDASSPVTGATFTFTDTVTADSSSNVPAGTVAWTVTDPNGNAVTCSDTTLAGGFATCTITNAIAGTYSASAVFTDTDGNFQGSTSLPDTVVVGTDATTSTVTNDASSPVTGATFTFTDTVTADSSSNVPAGTVAWTVTDPNGNAVTCSDTTLAGGFATCTITNAIAGTYSASAVFTDTDGNFQGSTSLPDTVVVGTDATTSTVTNDASSPVTGATFTFTDTVTADSSSNVPAGTVAWTVTDPNGNAVTCSDTTLAGGFATCTITNAIAGTYSASAVFTDTDGNFQGSTSLPDTVVVTAAGTVTTITAITPTPVVGQPITVSVHVASTGPGSGTPTGTVTITDGSQTCTTGLLNVSGNASCSLTESVAKGYTFTATYNSDGNYATSTSADTSVTVTAAGTVTTITAITPTPVVDQPITVSVHVASTGPGSGTPTGTVTITDGSQTCTTGLLNVSGNASCSLTESVAKGYTFTATYNSDGNYATSTSADTSVTVTAAGTVTTITAITPTPVVGQPITVSVHVASTGPGSGTPTGTVTITDGSQTCTTGLLNVSGNASCSLTESVAKGYTFTATYNSDGNYATSTSADTSVTVTAAGTVTTITAITPTPVVDQPITVSVHVASTGPGSGTPTGTVTITDGSQTCTTGLLNVSGNASCSLTESVAKGYTFTATYNSDGNYATSTSADTSVTVTAAGTVTTITAITPTPVVGQPITVSVHVASTGPGSGTPTGTVTITDGSQTCTTGLLNVSGNASCSLTESVAKGYTFTATYNSDGNYATSTSADTSVTVTAAAATHFVVTAPSTTVAGVAFNITVTAYDTFGNVATGYTGTIRFASSDSGTGESIPVNYTFNVSDVGVHVFSVTFVTTPDQTVSATDTVNPSITGAANVSVTPSTSNATHIVLSGCPSPIASGSTCVATATLENSSGNTTSYNGTVSFAQGITDTGTLSGLGATIVFTNGVASVTVAGVLVGSVSITAKGDLFTSNTVSFSVTPGPAAKVVWIVEPGTSTAGLTVAGPPTVEVEDAAGNPVSGATVNIAITSGPGGFAAGSVTSVVTGTNGRAVFATLLLDTAGSYTFTASDPVTINSPVSSPFTVNAAGASHISATSGSGQSATVGTAFANKLVATVTDNFGNPVAGVTVTFTVPVSGASATFATTNTAVTGANGQATSTVFTANGTAGGYNISATAAGVSGSATFAETNTTVTKVATTTTLSISGSSETYGDADNATLTATVTGSGSTLPSGTVTFMTGTTVLCSTTFFSSAGSHTITASCSAPDSLLLAVGPYPVIATYSGNAHYAGSSSSSVSPPSITVAKDTSKTTVSESATSAKLGSEHLVTFSAMVVTGNGEIAVGSVTIHVGPSVTCTALTNASGVASCKIGSNDLPTGGVYAVSATFAGDTNVTGSSSSNSLNFTVTVAPAITSAAFASGTHGHPFSFHVTATGYPAPTFSITSGHLPSGVSLNATTGELSGTLSGHSAGIYKFTITATNSAGTANQPFKLTVS